MYNDELIPCFWLYLDSQNRKNEFLSNFAHKLYRHSVGNITGRQNKYIVKGGKEEERRIMKGKDKKYIKIPNIINSLSMNKSILKKYKSAPLNYRDQLVSTQFAYLRILVLNFIKFPFLFSLLEVSITVEQC